MSIDEEVERLMEAVRRKVAPKVKMAATTRMHGVVSLSIHLQDGKVNHFKSGFEEVTKPDNALSHPNHITRHRTIQARITPLGIGTVLSLRA